MTTRPGAEQFIRNFDSLKHLNSPSGGRNRKWNATTVQLGDLRFLPMMTTDVTLSSTSRKIIIDAKYYRDALRIRDRAAFRLGMGDRIR